MPTDLHSGNFAGDRLEFSANALWRPGLGVPHIDRGRPSGQPDLDHRLRSTPFRLSFSDACIGPCFEMEHFRKTQAQNPAHAEAQKVPAVKPLTIRAKRCGHDRCSFRLALFSFSDSE